MIREWLLRRYVEADWKYLDAKSWLWWDDAHMARLRRRRAFWKRLSGGKA